MENKKKEYTGMKAEKIEFNSTDIIATSDLNKPSTEHNGNPSNIFMGECDGGSC